MKIIMLFALALAIIVLLTATTIPNYVQWGGAFLLGIGIRELTIGSGKRTHERNRGNQPPPPAVLAEKWQIPGARTQEMAVLAPGGGYQK